MDLENLEIVETHTEPYVVAAEELIQEHSWSKAMIGLAVVCEAEIHDAAENKDEERARLFYDFLRVLCQFANALD